ncbi:MAG: RNA methyltransferase [Parcubacteria group bacterium]|jgi:TrmH family RNA methyltransferase
MSPKTIKIHSENDIFQILSALKENRQKRQKERKFIFEGVRNIKNALQSKWKIEAFLYSPEKELSRWASGVLRSSQANFHYELPLKLMRKLSAKEDISELITVAHMRNDDPSAIPVKENFLTLVFDRPSSPGNLGTLIRSCDAFGASGLILTGHAVDLYDPETIRATTGSFFSFPSIRLPSHQELDAWLASLKKQLPDLQIVATDETGDKIADNHDFKKPTILLIGNEKTGLSTAYKEMADAVIKIPVQGFASSLNVACATSIILYEISRQRKK